MSDASTSPDHVAAMPVECCNNTREAESQTTPAQVDNKATQLYRITVSSDAATMTEKEVSTTDSLDLGAMTHVFNKMDQLTLENQQLTEKCDIAEKKKLAAVNNLISYANFASEEICKAARNSAELFDRFVPSHKISKMDYEVGQLINYIKRKMKEHECKYNGTM